MQAELSRKSDELLKEQKRLDAEVGSGEEADP